MAVSLFCLIVIGRFYFRHCCIFSSVRTLKSQIKLIILRDIYKTEREQILIHGAQIWGYRGAGEKMMKSKGIFKRKMFRNNKVYLERFGSTEDWNGKGRGGGRHYFCCE